MATSKYKTILDNVKTGIAALTLTNFPASKIHVTKLARDVSALGSLPLCLVCPFGTKQVSGRSNQRDDIAYPVLVALLRAGNQDLTADMDASMDEDEKISSKFRHQALSPAYTCEVSSDVPFDPQAFWNNYDATVILLRFMTAETRG